MLLRVSQLDEDCQTRNTFIEPNNTSRKDGIMNVWNNYLSKTDKSGMFWKYQNWIYGSSQGGHSIITMNARMYLLNPSWPWCLYCRYNKARVQAPSEEYCDTIHWITNKSRFIFSNFSQTTQWHCLKHIYLWSNTTMEFSKNQLFLLA